MPKAVGSLSALSPLDGRYQSELTELASFFSEQALNRYRIQVEVACLIELSQEANFGPEALSPENQTRLEELARLSPEDATIIKAIETEGWQDMLPTQHDVKAVEYYLQYRLREAGLDAYLPWLHFGLTSEDVNNLAYALMLRDSTNQAMVPALNALVERLTLLAHDFADLPMLARTHGQAASPTTFGKEMRVFAERLRGQLKTLQQATIAVKLNGASGNYNAFVVAAPDQDWLEYSGRVIDRLARLAKSDESGVSLVENQFTTQIEPHDSYVELFQIYTRINTIVLDLNQDMWRYISDGWLVQQKLPGQVGSSTMPHKVNPIDFEKSEGNLGVANALLEFFARKLPVSRLQRDLSDSTVERNFGVALGHSWLAHQSTLKGLMKCAVNDEKIEADLVAHPEVLAEAIQSVLRAEGVTDAYEQLKALTQGKPMTQVVLAEFVEGLELPSATKKRLLALTPISYIGLAAKLAKK